MAIVIVGLGNPGKEYEKTRHNAGRDTVQLLARQGSFDEFVFNKKANALAAEGKIDREKVMLVLPETFMNNSGKAMSAFVKSVRAAKQLLIIHDDLDLPVGTIKMVFARGSGGHKGVESVMRALKTDQFARIRIGISGQGKKNQAKKVSEEALAKKAIKKAAEAAALFATEGIDAATQFANTR